MEFVDTHCHIQFEDYGLETDDVLLAANSSGVTRLICVGCRLEDSQAAVNFAATREGVWASVGLHPHEARVYADKPKTLNEFSRLASLPKVVAIGECGLDYYYNHSPAKAQQKLLRFQIELALKRDLPVIFHVRDAFEDFWPIFDDYKDLRGVIHSFSSSPHVLEQILSRGLYVGLNGIMTFSKNAKQLAAAKAVPLNKLLLETDAPYLTPTPYRGTICQPKHVIVTAEFLTKIRGEDPAALAAASTRNALKLFNLT